MEYNTKRNKLILPEYGRNIQKVIEAINKVEDRELRTAMADRLVTILYKMAPDNKEGDLMRKLWDQVYIMSNFELDVDSPFPKPDPKEVNAKPRKVSYNTNKISYRHYGNNIQMFIDEINKMEESEEKNKMIKSIASQMKKLYLLWNRETVDDELIFKNIEDLSEGKLKVQDGVRLASTAAILNKSNKNIGKSSSNSKKKTASKNKSKN